MKLFDKVLISTVAGLFVCASFAVADMVTVTVTATGADAYSEPIRASGYLERVELTRVADVTSDNVAVTLATWDGTTELTRIIHEATVATNAAAKVYRPRIVGTDTGGTALLTAVTATGTGTNVSQVLVVPYEKYLLGGNMRLKVGASAGTNAVVTARIYYTPTLKN